MKKQERFKMPGKTKKITSLHHSRVETLKKTELLKVYCNPSERNTKSHNSV